MLSLGKLLGPGVLLLSLGLLFFLTFFLELLDLSFKLTVVLLELLFHLLSSFLPISTGSLCKKRLWLLILFDGDV